MFLSILYIMWPIHLQGLRLLHLTVKDEMHLQEKAMFDLDLGVKVTQNFAQYPLHYMAYSPAKFEVAMFSR